MAAMGRLGSIGAVLAVGLSLAAPAPVRAMTTDGVLITSVACITYTNTNLQSMAATYCVTARVLVSNPNIQASKVMNPTMMSSGATVTFCIWVANTSAWTSAFQVMVQDRIPTSIAYLTGQTNWVTGTTGGTVTQGYGNANAFPTYYWSGEPVNGQTETYAVRWIFNMIGPGKSAMVCWKGQVL